jgi:DNA-binding NarL/FixJ family response regulator
VTPIRLVLADDHPIVLHGLQQLFEREGFEVAAACRDGASALAAVREHQPDVFVLDLRMNGQNGLDVLRALAKDGVRCKTILLTAAARDSEVSQAMQLGALGVVLKDTSPDALVEGIRRVHRGESWIDRDPAAAGTTTGREGAADGAAMPALTPREFEIVRMVAKGLRNKVIAEQLSISEGTVKVHLHNIYDKLHVDGRLELVLCAQEKGLL